MCSQRTSRIIDLVTAANDGVAGIARAPAWAEAVPAEPQRHACPPEERAAVADATRELMERLRYEQTRRREQQLQSLQVTGGGPSTLEPPVAARVCVGVEVDSAEATVEAHALLDLHWLTPWLGISTCGVPAEYMTLVPGLDWAEVDGRLRCPHCESAGLPGA